MAIIIDSKHEGEIPLDCVNRRRQGKINQAFHPPELTQAEIEAYNYIIQKKRQYLHKRLK